MTPVDAQNSAIPGAIPTNMGDNLPEMWPNPCAKFHALICKAEADKSVTAYMKKKQTVSLVSRPILRMGDKNVRPKHVENFLCKVDNDCLSVGNRSDNFIVGLTNNHPVVHAPVLWNYTLCGQYPGAVPYGATVGINCINVYQRRLRFRYVIVQFPLLDDRMNFCEIEVFTVGMSICYDMD